MANKLAFLNDTNLGAVVGADPIQSPATSGGAGGNNSGILMQTPKEPGMFDKVFSTSAKEQFGIGFWRQNGRNTSDVVAKPLLEGAFGLVKEKLIR